MWVDDRRLIDEFSLWGKCFARLVEGDMLLSTTSHVWSKFYWDNRLWGDWGQSLSKCGGYDDPLGILNPAKTRKNIHTGFFEPYNFPKGWGQASNNYIQHIYSYSTLSNYSKAQHGWGNEFANTIGMHQWSLHNRSGNDVISGDYADSQSERILIDLTQWC